MKTTLFIPTLNEIEGMRAIMPRVKKEWVDEILVLDANSTDGTVEYAKAQGYRVVMQKSIGITNAYQEGLQVALGDVIIAFSPDGNSVPERIPEVVNRMKEGIDMLVVSRYLPGAGSEDDDPVTAFGNWLFTKGINILFGGKYTDALVMFRAFKKDIVSASAIDVPRAGFEVLLSIRCAKKKLRVVEIPGVEPKRIGGARKMNPLLNGLDILRLMAYERMVN